MIYEYENNKIVPSCKHAFKTVKSLPLPYVGNKKKLVRTIYDILIKNDIEFDSILDAFSGSGAVSYFMKRLGKKVISNDILSLAYHNAKAFVVNNNIRISDKDKCNLFNNYCNYNSHFVELNYLGEGDKITRFKKFTIKECEFLDNFRANINELPNDEAKSLAFAAISAVVLRLPFGNVDQSTDIMKHRMKQKEKYGKGTPNHDRRIGIYYDSEFNLNFKKWFLKYLNDFEEALCETPDCIAANNDTSYVLKHMPYKVDCAYFDPPYGGVSSNYASMYRFCEEYITQRKVEDDAKLLHAHKFVNLKTYESSFSEMLAAADNIPIWIFSYNDSSWKDINYITSIINKFKNKIIVESCEYDYIYRRQCGNKNKGVEYLIVAR